MTAHKTIGQLNGSWGLMFKIALATQPLLLLWGAWITVETVRNQYFRTAEERVTPKDLTDMERRLDRRLDDQPPADWKARILRIEDKIDAILQKLPQ